MVIGLDRSVFLFLRKHWAVFGLYLFVLLSCSCLFLCQEKCKACFLVGFSTASLLASHKVQIRKTHIRDEEGSHLMAKTPENTNAVVSYR